MIRIEKKDAKVIIEDWKRKFAGLLNTPVTVCFSTFNWPGIIITDIVLLNTTGMVNAPTKRKFESSNYTPIIIELVTIDTVGEQGGFRFVVEDTKIAAITNGVRLTTAAVSIDIRKT